LEWEEQSSREITAVSYSTPLFMGSNFSLRWEEVTPNRPSFGAVVHTYPAFQK